MSEPRHRRPPSSSADDDATARFLRGAGQVRDDGGNPILRFPPARWVVSMMQYLIAVAMIGTGFLPLSPPLFFPFGFSPGGGC
jgi:hypothetical protein